MAKSVKLAPGVAGTSHSSMPVVLYAWKTDCLQAVVQTSVELLELNEIQALIDFYANNYLLNSSNLPTQR